MDKNRQHILQNIKKRLTTLDSYYSGEENFLVMSVLKIDRTKLLLKEDFSPLEIQKIDEVLIRRLKGEPLDKILGEKNFYGRDFIVNNNVLSPRKETEILVEKVIEYVKDNFKKERKTLNLCDMCCGSGCIGLTVKKECEKEVKVTLCDKSPKALETAQKNCAKLDLTNDVKFVESDMFSLLNNNEKFDIIACNPPYIESEVCLKLSREVKDYDPMLALDGGKDGLDFYRILALKGGEFLTSNGKIFMEIGFNQKKSVENIFKKQNYIVQCLQDYSGKDRVIIALRKER